MTDEYLEAFVRESEEHIVELNNALLALEEDSSDRDAVDVVFRTAHTLKGNFAAMGFSQGADLAHAIEDLLDRIRDGRIEVSAGVMDPLFAAVDEIETIVAEIEAEGEPSSDPGPLVEDLRETIEQHTVDEPTASSEAVGDASADEALTDELLTGVDVEAAEGLVYKVEAIPKAGDMKGVDGMLVTEAVDGEFDLIESRPDREAIEDGDYDDGFELLLSANERDDVEAFIGDLAQLADATVTDVTERLPDGDQSLESATEASSAPSGTDDIKSVRVDVGRLDELYSQVEQLVTSRIKLRRSIEEGDHTAALDNVDGLDKITASLQNTVMDMRLIPLRKVVNTFPRLVRDLSRSQEKEVAFSMEGTDVELDRTILDEISDPLIHVLRNAVDHGIEPPEEREAAGKPREGQIGLVATRENDYVDITVRDDGAGLDPEAIRQEATERGVREETELQEMSDDAVLDLVFHPGFSTSEEVTDVSGRGVGMDIVHSTVNRLDGSVSVSSAAGEGAAVTLRLPVSIAIVRILFVDVDGRSFGLPIKAIDEITRFGDVETVNGRDVIEHRDAIYPVLDLRERLCDGEPTTNGDGRLIRVQESHRPVALRCDAVDRQEEVVIKPLEGELKDVSGVSGTAVVGDGQVVPIIDVATL